MLSTTFPAQSRRKCSVAASNANQMARALKLPGRLRAADVRQVFEKYPACLRCGATATDELLTLDHVQPFKLRGPNVLENLQILCVRCNRRKYMRTIDYRLEPRNASSIPQC